MSQWYQEIHQDSSPQPFGYLASDPLNFSLPLFIWTRLPSPHQQDQLRPSSGTLPTAAPTS